MADIKNVEKYIWDIANIWHNAGMDGTQYVGSTLYIMCLKKMIIRKKHHVDISCILWKVKTMV